MTVATQPPAHDPRTRALHEWTWILPGALYIVAVALAYGYEIFSFNLTIDEESVALFTRLERFEGSIGEGRWTMATLTLLLPATVMPTVSTALGVGLAAIVLWVLARRFLALSPWKAAVACAVAVTFPVLAFLFSFSTIAWIIGIGFVLALAFTIGISSPVLWHKLLGVVAGAAAIGVYDSFVVVIAVIALALAARAATWRSLIEGTAGAVLALALSRLIGLLYTLVFDVRLGSYTAGFIDVPGFFANPLGRSADAVRDVVGTFMLSSDRFGLTSPTLAVFALALLGGAIAALIVGRRVQGKVAVRIIALAGIVLVPFAAEAIAFVVVLRSMFYLPVLIVALASIAFSHGWRLTPRIRRISIVAFVSLTVLTVLCNTIIVNRLFSTAATTYALDQQLAFQIGQEKDLLLDGDQARDLPIVVEGLHGWPEGTFTSVHESIGLSFFELNENRTETFLRDHGVLVHEATDEQRASVESELDDMPSYPVDGWIAVENGVLLLKFSEED